MKDDEKDLVGYTFFMKKELFTIPLLSIREFKEFLLLNSTTETVEGELVYPPQVDDLYSLYTKIRNNNVVAILEFGVSISKIPPFLEFLKLTSILCPVHRNVQLHGKGSPNQIFFLHR